MSKPFKYDPREDVASADPLDFDEHPLVLRARRARDPVLLRRHDQAMRRRQQNLAWSAGVIAAELSTVALVQKVAVFGSTLQPLSGPVPTRWFGTGIRLPRRARPFLVPRTKASHKEPPQGVAV